MKLLISLVLLLFGFSNLCFAKHKFNPKIERVSYYNCGHCPCDQYYWKDKPSGGCSGTMGCCWPIYIYIYPKNIDKMIAENPEFKNEIGGDFNFNIDNEVQIYNCKNKIQSYIYDIKDGFKQQMKLLQECNKKDSKSKICSDSLIEWYIKATNDQILKLEQKLLIPNDDLLKDEICKEEKPNPKDILAENCYQLWKYDSCGYCSTMEIKSYYGMQQHCNKIIKKVLKKTGKLY